MYLYGQSLFNFNQIDTDLILKGYEYFRDKLAVEFLKILDLNTCPYCNKEYIFKVDIPKNSDSARVLVEFDHWLPKTIYKDYSCSFYNLIPVCHNCNHIKSDNNPDSLKNCYHPYVSFDNLNFQFSYFYHDLYNYKLVIKIDEDPKTDEIIKLLKIEELYKPHTDFELKDLIELKNKYPKNYLNSINLLLSNKNEFAIQEVNTKEVFKRLLGIEFEKNKFHKRPFSKFKSDIFNELMKSN